MRQEPKPQFRINIPLQRTHEHHMIHIAAITGVLTSCNFISFHVPETALVDRMSIVLTLFLTVVATKFLVGERLPQVGDRSSRDLRAPVSCTILRTIVNLSWAPSDANLRNVVIQLRPRWIQVLAVARPRDDHPGRCWVLV